MSLLFEWLEEAMGNGRADSAAGHHALVHGDTYLSWLGLHHRVERRARELAGFGIAAGDWVGLMVGNVPESVILTLALSKLDAVPVPLDPTTGGRDLDMIMDAAPLRGLVTRPNSVDPLAAPSGTLRRRRGPLTPRLVAEGRRRIQGTLLTCTLFPRRSPTLPTGEKPESVLITLDSGGDPKGVVRGRTQLRGIGTTLADVLGLDSRRRVLCSAALDSSQGFDLGFCLALARGATLFLEDNTTTPDLPRLIGRESIDVFAASPATFAAWTRIPTAKAFDQTPRLLSSGSPLPTSVALSFARRFRAKLCSCYHSLETGPIALEGTGEAPGTVGKPLPGVELRLGEGGSDSPQPLWVRGPSVTTTYVPGLRARGATPVGRADTAGWLRTGDLGSFDRDGHLVLAGREDDLVKIEGRRVALGEIEGCLEAFAKIRTAEARLEYDESGSARVIAKVSRSRRCTVKDILDHCAKHLAPHKVPARIEFDEPAG
jgi:acyl-CoA synthetase (AMP-forming)/AMP-acid ligase II